MTAAFLALALFAAPPGAARAPWSVELWDDVQPRLVAMRWLPGDSPELLLVFEPARPPPLEFAIIDEGILVLTLPRVADDLPSLPGRAPIDRLRLIGGADGRGRLELWLPPRIAWGTVLHEEGVLLQFDAAARKDRTHEVAASRPADVNQVKALRTTLDTGLDALARGRPAVAIARFIEVDIPSAPLELRAVARLHTGIALQAANLPLLAGHAFSSVVALGDRELKSALRDAIDERTRRGILEAVGPEMSRALEALQAFEARYPGAFDLVAADIPPEHELPVRSSWLRFEQATHKIGRAALGRSQEATDELAEAARTLLTFAEAPAHRLRARLLVAIIAFMNGDHDAASNHLDVAARMRPTPPQRARIALLRARMAHMRGDLDAAEAAYKVATDADPTVKSRVALERTRLLWGSGVSPDRLLPQLVPFNLDAEGEAHALLTGELYAALCLYDRAQTIATAVIQREAVSTEPLRSQLAHEAGVLRRATWDDIRGWLGLRLDVLSKRLGDHRRPSNGRDLLRRALRLRTTADDLALRTLRDRRNGKTQPPEPPGARFDKARFIDIAQPLDRCPVVLASERRSSDSRGR